MFASTVAHDRCQLFCIVRTRIDGYERAVLSYPRSDYLTAVRRAEWYQQEFDPDCTRYDYRVAMCD